MMCELWAGIEADYNHNARAPFIVDLLDVFAEKRGVEPRKIFVCEGKNINSWAMLCGLNFNC